MRPEARSVFEELKKRDVLIGVLSYNHEGNVKRILEAFVLLESLAYADAVANARSEKARSHGLYCVM